MQERRCGHPKSPICGSNGAGRSSDARARQRPPCGRPRILEPRSNTRLILPHLPTLPRALGGTQPASNVQVRVVQAICHAPADARVDFGARLRCGVVAGITSSTSRLRNVVVNAIAGTPRQRARPTKDAAIQSRAADRLLPAKQGRRPAAWSADPGSAPSILAVIARCGRRIPGAASGGGGVGAVDCPINRQHRLTSCADV